MSKTFKQALESRRTHYALAAQSPLSNAEIETLIKDATLLTPSAFNSQSQRVVVLLGDEHKKLWDLTTETLKAMVPAGAWSSTQDKMTAFGGAYGTVLFFDDSAVTEGLMKQFALYADNFPVWANQSNGMLQLVVWTALSEAGLGASLQHYNPLIDAKVAEVFNLPNTWKLLAQMPFGTPSAEAHVKDVQPIEQRLLVKGA